jgi:3D (Asp-Asp-Asp) domain-containing protein
MTITTYASKGSQLSIAEMDGNITDLDTRTRLGWRDNIEQFVPRPGDPDAPELNVFRDGIYLYLCPGGQLSEVFAYFHIDHDYAMGTALYPHVHWSSNSTETGTVRWGFEYTLAKGHQQTVFPTSTTVYAEQVCDGTPYKHYVAEVSDANAIPGDLVEPDTVLLVRVFRDGAHVNDTMGDVFGILVDLHYQAAQHTTPNKSPNFFA